LSPPLPDTALFRSSPRWRRNGSGPRRPEPPGAPPGPPGERAPTRTITFAAAGRPDASRAPDKDVVIAGSAGAPVTPRGGGRSGVSAGSPRRGLGERGRCGRGGRTAGEAG